MRAVAETAVPTDAEDLAEIVADLFFGHVNGSETFDTRCVDNPALRTSYIVLRTSYIFLRTSYIFLRTSYIVPSYIQFIHLAERSGVHSFVVGVGDLTGSGDFLAEKRIEQRAFAYARIAGEKGSLACQKRQNL